MAGIRGIKAIVDEACRIDSEVKRKNIRLDELKGLIREHAKRTGVRGIRGNFGSAVVSPFSKSSVDVMAAWVECGRSIRKFKNIIKVKIGELSNYLTDEQIERIKETETDNYKSVSLQVDDRDGEIMERLLRKLDL